MPPKKDRGGTPLQRQLAHKAVAAAMAAPAQPAAAAAEAAAIAALRVGRFINPNAEVTGNLGLRLNLKRAEIPSAFNNNANFNEFNELAPRAPGISSNVHSEGYLQRHRVPRVASALSVAAAAASGGATAASGGAAAASGGGGGGGGDTGMAQYYQYRASLPSSGAYPGSRAMDIFSPGLRGSTFNPNNLMNLGQGEGESKNGSKGGVRRKTSKAHFSSRHRRSRRHTRKSKH
jgi:hypothetical protein